MGWLKSRRESQRLATEEASARVARINARRCHLECVVCDYLDSLCRHTDPENLRFLGIVADARVEHAHEDATPARTA